MLRDNMSNMNNANKANTKYFVDMTKVKRY